jgi:DNA anti-recombination protein RmuC
VTPDRLEHDLNSVTDGLALAFDATALALGLTMITMFLTYLVDRVEQSVLETVDRYVMHHLAHRFERISDEGGQVLEAVRANARVLVQTTEELVERQAQIWARTLGEVDRQRAEVEERLQQRLTTALETALERTLHSHDQRLAALEEQVVQRGSRLLEQLTQVASAVQEQQTIAGQTAEGLAALTAALAQLQQGEQQLLRLQETLARNLDALAGAGSFEQAVHSLTAAIHLLTARTAATGPALRRPGVAA